MSLLPGEGDYVILYGPVALPAGARFCSGYLARPDLAGAFPTLVLVPSVWGITSGTKALCRSLARRGLAVVAVDIHRGAGPARTADRAAAEAAYARLSDSRALSDIADAYGFLRSHGTAWTGGIGVAGLGVGGRVAVLSASEHAVGAVVVAYAPLIEDPGRSRQAAGVLGQLRVPLLGLHGKDDEVVPVDQAVSARALAPSSEWVLYPGCGHDFLDDAKPGYRDEVFRDALGRVVTFLGRTLGTSAMAASTR